MLSVWDPLYFACDSSIAGESFLISKGRWLVPKLGLTFVNVYAPQSPSKKKQLWQELKDFVLADHNRAWVIFGDFNEVRDEDERVGSRFSKSGVKLFNEFIEASGLLEVRCGGRRFIRFSSNGDKLSKLDHIFVYNMFFTVWSNPTVEILPRSYSDHCPLFLNLARITSGRLHLDSLIHGWVLTALNRWL